MAISASGFYLSYLNYKSAALPPVVATRLNEFVLTDNPLSVSANFDFSISNLSSKPIFILGCEVATDGLNRGGGGYGEQFSPCGIKQFDSASGLELAPGQTEFYTVKHTKKLDSYDPNLALSLMGIELDDIQNSLRSGSCTAQISVSRVGTGFNQDCSLINPETDSFPSQIPSQKVFVLVLQTGTGDLIRTPVYLSLNQPWPWGR